VAAGERAQVPADAHPAEPANDPVRAPAAGPATAHAERPDAPATAHAARTHNPATALARTDELPEGTVVMPHGRLSAAREVRADPTRGPFTPVQLSMLDEALTLASRSSGLWFSVYLGRLGPHSRSAAEALHTSTTDPRNSVLVALSPGERVVEVVTGAQSSRRLSNNGCRLAVMTMVASFKEGDLVGGLVSGLRMMADQAGERPRRR
jgi:hypothetical protein